MSANPNDFAYPAAGPEPITGCVRLDLHGVREEERDYFERRFGKGIEIDRVGRFFLVHRDAPGADLRAARVIELQTNFRPAFCEHCAEAVARGGLFLFDSPKFAPKELRIVPVERPGWPGAEQPAGA